MLHAVFGPFLFAGAFDLNGFAGSYCTAQRLSNFVYSNFPFSNAIEVCLVFFYS